MKTISDFYQIAKEISKHEHGFICVGVIRHIDTSAKLFEGVYIPYGNYVLCIDIDRGVDVYFPRCKVYEECDAVFKNGKAKKTLSAVYKNYTGD